MQNKRNPLGIFGLKTGDFKFYMRFIPQIIIKNEWKIFWDMKIHNINDFKGLKSKKINFYLKNIKIDEKMFHLLTLMYDIWWENRKLIFARKKCHLAGKRETK